MRELFAKVYKGSKKDFYEIVNDNLKNNNRMMIVTVNPESFMISEKDIKYRKILLSNNTTLVPDGIGVVKAAKQIDIKIRERITGIDLATYLLDVANENHYTIALLGAKKIVINMLEAKINKEYPNIKIVAKQNGYEKDKDGFFKNIKALQPDICMVALGMPLQEELLYKHISKFSKGIFIGVGGSFDVLSDYKKRAPKLFIKLNLEWLYRICREPKRMKRFYQNNVKFITKVKKMKVGIK